MIHYNLEKLGWFNFENLIRCLFREIIGSALSTFSGSKDQGRDATFRGKASRFPSDSEKWKGRWIFQVKHREYSSQGAKYVRKELKKIIEAEIRKILSKYRFKCDNYIFVTNCPFTASDKDEINSIIALNFKQLKNFFILAEKDIEELLTANSKIVSAFPQILGLGQLKELTNWGLHQRSYQYLKSAQSEISKFVATEPYLKAIELLHKQNFCVLTGPPKMGKTCTAYALSAAFSTLGFEIYELRNQRDFYDAFTVKSKQLFICDDVFGDIALDASLRDDWTKGFVRLLRCLGSSHKLIWTAREYVLREAYSSSRLKEEYPDILKKDTVTVAVDSISRLEKAMILYNHAKDGNLPTDVIDFLKNDACEKIVDHECYSPESIRQLCTGRLVDFSKQSVGDKKKLLIQVDGYLSEPGEAWKAAYLSAHPCEQILSSEVMAAGGIIEIGQLRKRYEKTITDMGGNNPSFDRAISETVGTFLKLKTSQWGTKSVQFYHPSMRDLMIEVFQFDRKKKQDYLKQLQLSEIPSIIKIKSNSKEESSSKHKIGIDTIDIDVIKNHLVSNLLPNASLMDMVSVLSELVTIINEKRIKQEKGKLRSSDDFPPILWIILDLILSHACNELFYELNVDCIFEFYWRRLFENLRLLLPLTPLPIIPLYIPGLLMRLKNIDYVKFWGVVVAARSIAPTLVEQAINFEDRFVWKDSLSQSVQEGLHGFDLIEKVHDYNELNDWHDEYESLPDECRDYESFFMNDEPIEGWEDLENTLETNPRVEADYEYDDYPSSTTTSPAEDIKSIFSDL